MAIQKEINKENKWSQRVVVSSDGKSIENWSRREIRPSLPELEDNIAEEPEDVTILEDKNMNWSVPKRNRRRNRQNCHKLLPYPNLLLH